jgi:hypothetical protein
MKHFLLFYEVSSDYLELRPQFRAEHLKLAWEAQQRGEIVVAGALADPPDGAVLMFQGAEVDRRAVRAGGPLCRERPRHALACSRVDDCSGRTGGQSGQAGVRRPGSQKRGRTT